jgi:hypothetical protein
MHFNRSHLNRSTRTILALALVGGLVAASCSDDSKGDDTTTPDTTGLVTTTTDKPAATSTSETTADTSSTESTVVDETSTTVPAGPTYPLTGLPLTDPAAANRPAMVVKIDNHPDARPQSGLNEADIVYEENVEHLTRFAAVFQSNMAEPVGPIRSGRTQDVDLLGSLNKPIFAWSGGNPKVSAAINGSDLVPVNETRAGKAMFRNKNRSAPHNLYGSMSALYTFAPADAAAPAQQFLYRPGGASPAGEGSDGVKVSMDGIRVHWQWDAASGTYLRFSDDKVHKDAINDDQVATNNVVVLNVDYKPSPADPSSPEAQTEGFGVAWVFSGGKVIKGAWVRADRLQPFSLQDDAGNPILLTPGRTFVELARGGKSVIIPTGTDPDSITYK